MAEFNFFGIWKDSLVFLQDLISLNRFSFVVEMGYQTDEIYQFTSLTDDIIGFLKQHNEVYIWSEEYSSYPPLLKPRNPSGYRWIDSRGCGPFLVLLLPRGEEHEDMMRLNSGFLQYLSYYVYQGTNIAYKPTDTLKQAYKDIQKILCKRMGRRYVQINFYNRIGEYKTKVLTFWIGRNGLKLIEEGKGGIQLGKTGEWYTKWFTKSNLVKTRNELEHLSKDNIEGSLSK